jgi:hypothetical protein
MTYPAAAQVVVGTRTLMIALAAELEQSTQSGRLPEVPGSERGELALSLARPGTLVFSDLEGAHLHPERFWRTFKNTVARCRREWATMRRR